MLGRETLNRGGGEAAAAVSRAELGVAAVLILVLVVLASILVPLIG
jgi:hypothetical protein